MIEAREEGTSQGEGERNGNTLEYDGRRLRRWRSPPVNADEIRELATELAVNFREDLIQSLTARIADDDPQCPVKVVGRCQRMTGHSGSHVMSGS